MAILRYTASADTIITNGYNYTLTTRGTGSNMGYADSLEVYSIYGETSSSTDGPSQELARTLINFPVTSISADRTAGIVPASGSVSFYLRMYNVETAFTLPQDFTLEVWPLSASWGEGTGLDMDEYTNLGTANWISSSDGTAWGQVGGVFYTAPLFSASFPKGYEDLEVDITPLVERWLQTSGTSGHLDSYGVAVKLTGSQEAYFSSSIGAATATITFAGCVSNDQELTLVSTDGTSVTYTAAASPTPPQFDGSLCSAALATAIATEIAASTGHDGKILVNDDSAGVLALTQSVPGITGDTTITEDLANTTADATFANGASPNTGSILYNITGSTDTYYTKRFSSRSTSFFFKRPVLEARWDSRIRDNRGDFYYSSSAASATDNLNTLYYYNYVRGRLRNVPNSASVDTTGSILVSIYSGSLVPTGSKLLLPIGGDVVAASDLNMTGGWVSTGIYSASFALTAAVANPSGTAPLMQVFDVWHDGGATPLEYYSGSLQPKTLDGYDNAPTFDFNTAVKNLKSVYSTKDNARFRFFVRSKYWSPTIYTVATANNPTAILPSASFKIFRVTDEMDVIPYGTGSDNSTYLSYDVSGNYFDMDMSMLEKGYMYGIKLSYYNDSIGDWIEQPQTFKFRVEE